MIKIRERQQSMICVVDIDPFFDESNKKRGFRQYVSVWSKYELDDQMPTGSEEWKRTWKRAEISWSSIGTVTASEAEAFAEAIRIAAKHGAVMDAQHGLTVTHSDTQAASTAEKKVGPQ